MIRIAVLCALVSLAAGAAPARSVLRSPIPQSNALFDSANVRINAAFLLSGAPNLTVEFPVNARVALAPYWVTSWSGMDNQVFTNGQLTTDDRQRMSFNRFGMGVNWYLSGARNTDSLVFTPFAAVAINNVQLDQINKSWSGSHIGYSLGFTFSYQLFWPNGLNASAGVGMVKDGPTTAILDPHSGNPEIRRRVNLGMPDWIFPGVKPVFQLMVGYAL